MYSTVLYPASYLGTVQYLDHYIYCIQYSIVLQYSTSATVAVPGYPGILYSLDTEKKIVYRSATVRE